MTNDGYDREPIRLWAQQGLRDAEFRALAPHPRCGMTRAVRLTPAGLWRCVRCGHPRLDVLPEPVRSL